MKKYLTMEQKKFIFENLDLVERFKEKILKDTWYIQDCDFPENYAGDENIFPYQIVDENIDYMIDCITKEFFKEIEVK